MESQLFHLLLVIYCQHFEGRRVMVIPHSDHVHVVHAPVGHIHVVVVLIF